MSAEIADAAGESGERTFRGDVLLTLGGKVAFVTLGGLLTVLVARELGPSGQGVYATAFTLTLILVQLGSAGLAVSNPYFAAHDPQAQRSIVMHSLWIAAVVSLTLSAAVVAIRWLAPSALPGIGWTELALTLAAIPAALATMYLQGVLLGRKDMVAYNLVDVIQVASALVALLIAFALAEVSIAVVLAVVAGGRYVSLVFALFALRPVFRGPAIAMPGLVRRLLAHSTRVYLVGLVVFVLVRLDLLLVNAIAGSEDAGQYSIAVYIGEGLVFIPMVIGINLLPRLANSEGSDLSAQVLRLVTIIWGTICVLSIPGVIFGIPLLFGESYNDAVGLYLWLLPGAFAMGLTNSLTVHYYVRGYPTGLIVVWGIALLVNIFGNLVLLPSAGVVVAPILASVAYLFVLLMHLRAFAGETGSYGALVPRAADLRLLRNAASIRGGTSQ